MKFNFCFKTIIIVNICCIQTIASAQILNNINPFKKDNATKEKSEAEANPAVVAQLRNDVVALSSDKMMGRKTGTKGELVAVDYIEKRFQAIGLEFYGTTYRRSYKFISGREVSPETKISINDKKLLVPFEAFPLSFSAAVQAENFVLPNSLEPNNFWVIPLYESAGEAAQADFDWEKAAYDKTVEAIDRGASGVIFYDSYGAKNLPKLTTTSRFAQVDVPVWIVQKKVYDEQLKGLKTMRSINVNAAFRDVYGDGTNIMGYINNSAQKTVIVMAHYDGLGMGNSILYPGANSNASGVAAMFNMAQEVRKSSFNKYNYLFVAFSGGEMDQIGARKFVEAKNFDSSKIAYILNLDMVGAYNAKDGLTIGGVGTANPWRTILRKIPNNIKMNMESKGSLVSDHLPFYNKGVCYLYFFSSYTNDYNSATDLATKLNYKGLYDISEFGFSVLKQMEAEETPKFKKALDEVAVNNNPSHGQSQPVYKVSLGIIPDPNSQNDGVIISDVTPGKPAALAGLMKNDVIIQIGAFPIQNIQSYMDALSKFEPGKKTIIKIKRSSRLQQYTVVFQ